MNRFPLFVVIAVNLTAVLYAQPPSSAQAVGKDVIFLIDQSASMNKDNLFRDVKKSIKDAVAQGLQKGDKLVVMGFDGDVRIIVDQDISNPLGDIFELNKRIDGLQAKGQWTYITKALEVTARRVEEFNKAYPDWVKVVYLFTDGKNEPPPTETNPLTYTDLVKKYFSTFTAKNSYMYVFRFGVVQDTAQKAFVDKIGGDYVDVGSNLNNISIATIQPYHSTFQIPPGVHDALTDTLRLEVGYVSIINPFDIQFISNDPSLSLTEVRNIHITKAGQPIRLPFRFTGVRTSTELTIPMRIAFEKKACYVLPDTVLLTFRPVTPNAGPAAGTQSSPKDTVSISTNPEKGSGVNPIVLYVFLPVILLALAAFGWLKWGMQRFPTGTTLNYQDPGSKSSFDLTQYTTLWTNRVMVGSGRAIDLDLGDGVFALSPSAEGTILKVIKGSVQRQDSKGVSDLNEGEKLNIEGVTIVVDGDKKFSVTLA